MGSLNRVTLLGTVGQDLILRQTAGNIAVTSIRLVTNDRRKCTNDEWVVSPEWHEVVVFGKKAESCMQFLTKGRQVLVEGKISSREYTDKEGNKRRATEIIADNVQFVGAKAGATTEDVTSEKAFDTDEIPF